MTPRKKVDLEQQSILQARVTTAPCCPSLRRAVTEWRAGGYKGATETSRTLLRHWFETDHRLRDGTRFAWHYFQREAVETMIYAYEVAKVRRHRDLLEAYAPNVPGIRLLQHDDFARYAIKMATGSGKTKVMSLAIAWQYFNAVAEGADDYARTFLVVAPNVIVFERLRTDFEGGRIFITDPIIPAELRVYWDMDFYMRGDPERVSSQGAVYLSNVQQLYDPRPPTDPEPEPMAGVLGPRAPATLTEATPFRERIQSRAAPVLVINDEGHHTHDEDNEWNKVIRGIHENTPGGLSAQLDFSATPRYAEGGLFTWTIYDYPLKQAIIDNVVKRPMKGVAKGIREQPSDVASVRYRAYLTAGVERWREYCEQLEPLGKRPLLFIMMNSTAEADDVADYLRTKYPAEFGGEDRCLVIHTDRKGEISKKDVEKAREVSRRVDEGTSPVNAIVSVLMLREGWDVQSVTVIVGLRPYTAKANILPEQTIGRGLRLMFRNFGGSYTERVDVIGNNAFLKFVEQLEKEEDIALETTDLSKKLVIVSIWVDEEKLDHDITIPTLSPVLARKKTLAEEIAGLDIDAMKTPALPKKPGDAAAQSFQYEGYDIITLQKEVEREYTIPEPSTAEEVISYYAKRISQEVKLPSQFASLVPKVRQFLESKAFGETVDLSQAAIVKAIASPVAQYVVVKTFKDALRGLIIEEHSPTLVSEGRNLSETPPFPYSRPTLPARKTVFNLVAADNEFERDFARFLENASDVRSFAKLPSQFGFAIEYVDAAGNLRYYEPDFVAVDFDGVHHLIETKGREDIDVQHKDRAATIWCENATMLTETSWTYIKVPQTEYTKLQPSELSELRLVFGLSDDNTVAGAGGAKAAEDAPRYDA